MPKAYHQVPGFLQENYGKPGTWDFKIDRMGICIMDDVVIIHYLLMATANEGADSSQARATRITHTWVRDDAGWKILGGMSNVSPKKTAMPGEKWQLSVLRAKEGL